MATYDSEGELIIKTAYEKHIPTIWFSDLYKLNLHAQSNDTGSNLIYMYLVAVFISTW